MSTLDVVAQILREVAPRALNAREIVGLAEGRLPTASRTPETVVSRDLAIDVKRHAEASRFLRVAAGEFLLKEALPTVLYNDVEPYVAAWTRNLIAAGEIAAGVVDERSVRDLQPADIASYRQCHFFSGIGTWSRALRDAGWPDDVNVWTGSCPCQDFSDAGKRRGFDGDLHLWPDWFRLIRACRPAVILGEQVASKAGRAWLDLVFADLEGAGYTCRAFDLPAASSGAPHARQRIYFVAYARERGREVVGAPWLHDRGQPGLDAPGLGAARGTDAADDADAVSDADGLEWHERWACQSHGRSPIESDRHGEADGSNGVVDADRLGPEGGAADHDSAGDGRPALGGGDDDGTGALGDAGVAGGRRDAGALPGEEGAGEGEWLAPGGLADEPLAAGAAHDGEVVFCPGDRIVLDGDPGWCGAVRGFWGSDVEWIYCRSAPKAEDQDGCWRPAESGTQPLVDGLAAQLGRTRAKRLRGYGNSIVRPLAIAFIEAVIDALVDGARELARLPEERAPRRRRIVKETEGVSGEISEEIAEVEELALPEAAA